MDKRILVAEDDPASMRLLVYTLNHEGYQVLTAVNGLEGFRKARQEKPDLVILDVMLPGIDGFEICHRLRSDPQTAGLPILLLSGKAQETDKATGRQVGANAYLTKPWQRPELVSKVAAMLKEKNGQAKE